MSIGQLASKKNFQLVPPDDSDNIVLLFGKVAPNRCPPHPPHQHRSPPKRARPQGAAGSSGRSGRHRPAGVAGRG